MDDDDFWESNHLLNLYNTYKKYPNCIFAYTQSKFRNSVLPFENVKIFENNLLPRYCFVIHSSISFRCDIIKFNYFTTHNEKEITIATDGLMWGKISDFIKKNNQYCCIYIPILTCNHEKEKGI